MLRPLILLCISATLGLSATANGASATMLRGAVQYQDIDGRIGIRVSNEGRIDQVHPGSPAQKAGLREGDVILAVDGQSDAVDQIHGEPGTAVSLSVRREEAQLHFRIPRVEFTRISYSQPDMVP